MSPLAGCAALAVVELDATLVAQTFVSRPFVAGVLFGFLAGSPRDGALIGASCELLSLADLPVGGCLTWSAPVAAGVGALLAGSGAPLPVSLAAGLAAGVLHARAEAYERAYRGRTAGALAARAAAGGVLGPALGASIAAHAAMTFSVALAVLLVSSALERRWWALLPDFARAGMSAAAFAAPWIGMAGVASWGIRR